MCGIAGIFGKNDPTRINKILDKLKHRGPNDRGVFENSFGTLGHMRLSIVDVEGGKQPILTCDRKSAIVANGEIYNFKELKKKFLKDIKFTTNSDSEVILHLFHKKNKDVLKHLEGMFAFAILDESNFFIARDPIGIKPLYYGYKDKNFYIASELRALLDADIDDVYEFPNGHYYTPKEGFVSYHSIDDKKTQFIKDVEKAKELIYSNLIAAVEKRLLADKKIPVGAFCSGGLDSSLISAICAKKIPNLHTFVVGMKDKSGKVGDDIEASYQVAKHIGSNHHSLIFDEDDYIKALETVIKHLETYEPSLVRSSVPCYFTSKLAKDFVTVALTGEGADEIFAGYHYMKNFSQEAIHQEGIETLRGLHNLNLQRADRMGMLFSIELRVPFLDLNMIDIALKIDPSLKIKDGIEKWILRKAFEDTNLIPENILWRYKVQYTQGAGSESVGADIAENTISDAEYRELNQDNPDANITDKETAFYYKIFKKHFPNPNALRTISFWKGFKFKEEREELRNTI